MEERQRKRERLGDGFYMYTCNFVFFSHFRLFGMSLKELSAHFYDQQPLVCVSMFTHTHLHVLITHFLVLNLFTHNP